MISDYVETALHRARYKLLEDKSFAAIVPGLRGVIATGKTLEDCRAELAEVIEEWILFRVSRGLAIPSLGKQSIKIRKAS